MRYAYLASLIFSKMILNLQEYNKVVNTVLFKCFCFLLFCITFYPGLFCFVDRNGEVIADVRKSDYFQILSDQI